MKRKDNTTGHNCNIHYFDLFGLREVKKDFLSTSSISTVKWKKLEPEKNYAFFTIKDFSFKLNYEKGLKINVIFNKYSSGVKTHRDNFIVSMKEDLLESNIKAFIKLDKNEIIQKFKLKSTRDWNFDSTKRNVRYDKLKIYSYYYRPFDIRYIYYDLNFIDKGTNRFDLMKHFIPLHNLKNEKDCNLGLCCSRGMKNKSFNTIFITNLISDIHIIGGLSYIAPLFIYQENGDNSNGNEYIFKEGGKRDNFAKEFRQYIKSKYSGSYSPEQILGYIYAVLHSTTYRTKYLEFLKIDFPRIPFTDDEYLFKELSEIGFELIEHHLLKKTYSENICQISGSGENYKVEKVEFEKGKVRFNKNRFFEPVPEEIWNFYIGGYQVLDKWLKERKKHEISLSSEDVRHFIDVVNVLDFTIKTMSKIDDKTRDWI